MHPSKRSKSYAAAALLVANGIKTSFATSVTPTTLVPADFDGTSHAAGVLDLPRTVTITLSNTAGAFNAVDPIVITGRRSGGARVTESLTPATTGGNATLRGVQGFDVIESIFIPAQGSGGGTFTIGVQDICAPWGEKFCAVKLHADGTLNIQYGEAPAGAPTPPQDAIPVVVLNRDTEHIEPTRVLTAPGKTVVGVTVYL